MFSYEQRYKTFTNMKWLSGYASNPHLLAICGFICKSNTLEQSAMCVYCKKHLEGWEESDVPILEHFAHKKDCSIFTPNKMTDKRSNSFIRFDLKEGIPFIFCYKCGSTDKSHKCLVTKRFSLNLKKPSDFFFIKLISGEYKETIDLYMQINLYLPKNIKDIFGYIFESTKFNMSPLTTVRALIGDYIEKEVKNLKDKMDKDIEKYLQNSET
ncbi:Baculoviral IAP repeat-containing protein 5 (BIRC5) [Vairimorpha necatrix]|uniref:Baculoviral IAP repeat-containing protein 5 (BIRC5) n=1 Tax=Vairimorpha necatrix TaxID=6039 RepID=A0AAX4JCD2_9MICR